MFTRARYQFGWLELRKRKRGPSVWLWRYRSTAPNGNRDKDAVVIGNVEQYPTKALAWKAAEGLRLTVNQNNPGARVAFGALIDRYMREQLPERYGTASKYRSWLTHHIKPKWGEARGRFAGLGFPKPRDRQAMVALDNSAESSDPRRRQSWAGPNRLAHLSTQLLDDVARVEG